MGKLVGEHVDSPLTKEFIAGLKPVGLMYPKVIKHKAVRNYRDYGYPLKKKKLRRKGTKN